MSEKKMKTIFSELHLDWMYGVSILDIKRDLNLLEENGFTHVEMDYDYSFDDVNLEIKGYKERLETDDEYQNRMNKNKLAAEARLARDKKVYEELKKKFEQ